MSQLTCPICGSLIPWREFRADLPFRCPACSERVRVPKSVHVDRTIAALVVVLATAYVVSSSVPMFLLVAAVLYLPGTAALSYFLTLAIGYPLEAVPDGGSRELGE